MLPDLKGIKVAVLGGDAREIILVSELARLGAQIQVVGLPVLKTVNVSLCDDIAAALKNVQAVILPVPGINKDGTIYSALTPQSLELSESHLVSLPASTPIFAGFARERLKDIVARCNLQLIELLERDEVAILNSIPSAEGAVQMAMEETAITIHGSCCFVLGFGRTGATIARLLQGMGAKVTVVARRAEHRARVYEMGMTPRDFAELHNYIKDANIIFNTVPALVLTNCHLSKLASETVIIDVASSPGGTDFDAAARLGVKALLTPGLPGKFAPKTAGEILAQVVPRLLLDAVGG